MVILHPGRSAGLAKRSGAAGGLEFDIDVLEDLGWRDAMGTVGRFDQIIARPTLLLAAASVSDDAGLIETSGLGQKAGSVKLPVIHGFALPWAWAVAWLDGG
jgi:hypothetical protein